MEASQRSKEMEAWFSISVQPMAFWLAMSTLRVSAVDQLNSTADCLQQDNVNVNGCPIVLQTRVTSHRLVIQFGSKATSKSAKKAIDELRTCWISSKGKVLPRLLPAGQTLQPQDPRLELMIDVGTSTQGEEYIIVDGFGQRLPHVPPLPVGSSHEAEKVVLVMAHIAQYTLFKVHRNPASHTGPNLFSFSLKDYQGQQNATTVTTIVRARLLPAPISLCPTTTINKKDHIILHFKNNQPLPSPDPPNVRYPLPKDTNSLYAYFFDLTPNYGVHRMVSTENRLENNLIEPQQELEDDFPMEIPPELSADDSILDILKAIVTTSLTDFDSIGMKDLNDVDDLVTRGVDDDDKISDILEAILNDSGMRSNSSTTKVQISDWHVEQRIIETVRKR
ncbi:MAG: hypothetical protein M1824_001555 [Vezdaea acicularis]|nr:MAG: hypothetical protein M1824_001555 [Vezdaea acicularis]